MFVHLQYLPSSLVIASGVLVFSLFSVLLAYAFSNVQNPAWTTAFRNLHPPLCASLMVAFSIFAVIVANTEWQNQESSHSAARSEAHALKRMLYHMPADGQGRPLLKQYIESAMHDEWPRMAEHRRGHPNTTIALIALVDWGMASDTPYDSTEHRLFFQEALSDLSRSRDQRLTLARATIPAVLWLSLLISAAAVMIAVVITHAHARRTAIIISILYGSVMGAILASLLMLDHPFAGSVSVDTRHLENVHARI